jgi:hypothetical protein
MATMATKASRDKSKYSWEYYIEGKDDWKSFEKNMVLSDSFALWKDFTGTKTATVKKAGTRITLLGNKSQIIPKGAPRKPSTICANVEIGGVRGWVPINKIEKPSRGASKSTTAKEDIALRDLDRAIKKRVKEYSGNGICIVVRKHAGKGFPVQMYMDCTAARTIKGTPKSDFAIVNSNSEEICQISHKDGGGAKAYQQYGGTSPSAGKLIHKHDVVQNSFRQFVNVLDDITTKSPKQRYKVKIPWTSAGKKLMNMAIYGPEYNDIKFTPSRENVNFIGQGTPSLVEYIGRKPAALKSCGLIFELQFTEGVEVNGCLDHFKDPGYVPYVIARYTSDRKFTVDDIIYKKVRVLIAPEALVPHAKRLYI